MSKPHPKHSYGYSYWDTMLSPILEAVKEVYTKPGKKFIFGPEGEMGGTVFYAPESYQKVRTAGRVGGGHAGGEPAAVNTCLSALARSRNAAQQP